MAQRRLTKEIGASNRNLWWGTDITIEDENGRFTIRASKYSYKESEFLYLLIDKICGVYYKNKLVAFFKQKT